MKQTQMVKIQSPKFTDNGDYTRRNRFTGESIELTKEEAKKHDELFVHEALASIEDKEL